jgi:hypothetical protein
MLVVTRTRRRELERLDDFLNIQGAESAEEDAEKAAFFFSASRRLPFDLPTERHTRMTNSCAELISKLSLCMM